MISIRREEIAGIPCLIVVPDTRRDEALPLVIYYHGFNGEKEASLTIAYKLAENNQRVVLPDSLHHGERKGSITQREKELAFWHIVQQNVEEIAVIKQFFMDEKLVKNEQIGLAGTSMGGITTYAAFTTYDWIKVAAVVMGTPKVTEFAQLLIEHINKQSPNKISDEIIDDVLKMIKPMDITLQPEKINNRPLLAWHGEKDELIPVDQSIEFFTKYQAQSNVRFVKEKNRMHHVSRLAVEETVQWFTKYFS